MVKYKYSDEQVKTAVARSKSMAGVLRELGIKQSGGNHSHMKKRIDRLCLDTSHFLGQGHNKGKPFKGKKAPEEILIVLPEGSNRPKHKPLKRAILGMGIPYECNKCGNSGTWQGKELTLEVDHVDGNWLDNRLHNLRFLCPNCHSQCPTSKRRGVFILGKSPIGSDDRLE